MTPRKILLITGIGPLVGAVEIAGMLAYYRMVGAAINPQAILWTAIGTTIWGFTLPLIVYWSEKDPLRVGGLRRLIPLHLVRGVVASCLSVAGIGLARWLSHDLFGTELM